MVSVVTFTGRISGLKAASLHAQYFEEYLRLAEYLDKITIVTDTVEYLPDNLPSNLTIQQVPKIKIPKIYGATKTLFYTLGPLTTHADIVYVRTFSPPELMSLWMSKKLGRKRTLLTLGGTWLFGKPYERPGLKKSIFRWILRRAAYSADAVTVYSRYMMPEIRYFLPRLDPSKVRIIHNSVNIQRFRPGLSPPNLLKNGADTVFWVGRINEGKGVGDLIEAFKTVCQHIKDVQLVIAGTGDNLYVKHLKKKTDELGLAGKVLFIGGIPNEEVPRYMANCSVFAYPSRGGEGIPRAILEAMACEAPVVATKVSGIPEAIIHGGTGLLVERQNIEQLADALITLLGDKNLARRLGEAARRKIEKEFSHEVVIPQIAELLKQTSLS
ncbi:MAG: glycosyltransferase family 4 protein [Candidatus Caldarchaeum sp.]|nr:glycosyltransferase family 4 protein [Candidatus Caldarchaeales archaeon]